MQSERDKYLNQFVLWARCGRKEPVGSFFSEDAFEYVVSEIEKLLEGKGAFHKKSGRPENRDFMWRCFFMVHFAVQGTPHKPLHKSECSVDSAFNVVGNDLCIDASTVESHARKARNIYQNNDVGKNEFEEWVLSNYRNGTLPGVGGKNVVEDDIVFVDIKNNGQFDYLIITRINPSLSCNSDGSVICLDGGAYDIIGYTSNFPKSRG